MAQNIAIERVDHIGVRVRNLDRALGFFRVLGFTVVRRAEGDDVAIIRNEPRSGAQSRVQRQYRRSRRPTSPIVQMLFSEDPATCALSLEEASASALRARRAYSGRSRKLSGRRRTRQ